MKTLGIGQIDWTGIKSALAHAAIGLGLSALLVLIGVLQMYSYGVYTPIVAMAFVFIVGFIKKLAQRYSVALPNTTVPVTDATGPVTPDSTL